MSKRGFRVVTDSTADVPAAWLGRWGIEVVPLNVLFGTESFRDGVDLDPDRFFTRLAAADRLPTTSAPAPGAFARTYQRLSEECDGVISIHIGAQLSGTVEAARAGASEVEGFPVHVVDSQTVSLACGFLCRVAAEAPDLAAAVQGVEERIPRTRIIAVLDTLRYIEMGGRVSRAQAMVGSLLDLKPILGVAGGRISPLDRVRTRGRAIARAVELLEQDMPVECVAALHGQAPEDCERLRRGVLQNHPGLEIETGEIGTVLATHTGPRALGFAYITR